jgi:uncharacterized protein (TIGR02679 family)
MTAVPGWLADPALSRLWAAARAKLERGHLTPGGRVVLAELRREERHALGDLLAQPIVTDRVSVDLAELDQVLARRSPYRGLAQTVVAITGRPLSDRRAERSAVTAAREAPLALARELLATALADVDWGEAWLAGVRRSGLLTRGDDATAAVRQAVAALAMLVPAARTRTSRTDLAAHLSGSAHGLDDGTVAAQLVLRALALDAGVEPPTTAASRRGLWERYGVHVDAVSSTCLALGLHARGDGPAAQRLHLAAGAGDPVHLTPRDLRGIELAAHPHVLVCENPRVLEAVADQFAGAVPTVCTAGQPALVVLDVLRRLAQAGATLRYHGDFDWPGITIANRLVTEADVVPWLMRKADYEAAARRGPAALPLAGTPVVACWDDTLHAAMNRHGVAVHEESVLNNLLDNAASFS